MREYNFLSFNKFYFLAYLNLFLQHLHAIFDSNVFLFGEKKSLKWSESPTWGILFLKVKKSRSVSMALPEISGCEFGHARGFVTPSGNISKG